MVRLANEPSQSRPAEDFAGLIKVSLQTILSRIQKKIKLNSRSGQKKPKNKFHPTAPAEQGKSPDAGRVMSFRK